MYKMEVPKTEQVEKIKQIVLAKKHGVSRQYVGMVLSGERKAKSAKALAILEDAHRMIDLIQQIEAQ